ncbi:AraC family transcriptional regulator [Streptomyces caatingaensis]|uniref:HTH-type transcriptional regulator RipA n=1 Tax=Streptomyces caatingaensis TaxID=1678637 RepID=A0A0K9XGR7_9ACTN|nr:helix-turn-helix transcriptional regulator [Streptomyces caatingaensis]KNB52246.1 AraC family transcriptional regulator [Streptomyces caatingaensis]
MPTVRHTPHAMTGIRPLPSGGGIDAHWHDEHQIVYAARGVLSVTTGAGTWVAPATRAIWVPAGTVHEHRAYGETDVHLVGLPAGANPLGLDRPAVLEVGPLLRELIIAYTREPEDGSAERRRLGGVLLDRLRHSGERPLHVPTARDPRLAAVCAVLREDPADGRTLARLGAGAGVSERTLSRLFKAEFGMSFPRWRTQLRLQHALLLLAEGAPVTAVAHRCGWSSSSAFIDAFRRAFGHTPGAHRSSRTPQVAHGSPTGG